MSHQMGVNAVVETLAGSSSGNPAVVQSVSALLGVGASVGVLPWGRAQESEADHLGMTLMAKAGLRASRRSRSLGAHGRPVEQDPR